MFIRPIDITEYYKSCKKSEVTFNRPNYFENSIEDLYIQFANMDSFTLDKYIPLITGAISLNTLCLMRDKKLLDDPELSKVWDTFQEYVYLSCAINNMADAKYIINNKARMVKLCKTLNKYGLPVAAETIRKQIQKRIAAVKEKSYDRKNI